MKPVLACAAAVFAASALAGCPSNSDTGVAGTNCVGDSCRSGTTGRVYQATGGGTSAAASTGGGGSSGGGSSGGGSSSSASGGTGTAGGSSGGSSGGSTGDDITCANISDFAGDGGACPGTWYGTRYADLGTCAPIAGANVEALGVNTVPIASTTTDGTGDFVLCLPAGAVYTPYVQAGDYPPTYLAQQDAPPPPEWIGLISNDTLGAVTSVLGGSYDPTKGLVAVFFQGDPACNEAGWTVSLQLPDGGALPDGGYDVLYLNEFELPDPSLTSTSASGSAIALNVDPSIASYVAVTISNPDAGGCHDDFASLGETGQVYVSGNAMSYFTPYLVQ